MVLRETPAEAADSAPATTADDDDALRKRLLSRIAVAGVAIVGLLGGLAVYDSLNRPAPPAMPPMAAAPTEPPPPAEAKKTAEEPAEPALEKEGQAVDGDKEAGADTAVVPEKTAVATGGPVVEAPLDTPRPAKPITPPATARQATIKPAPPAAVAARPEPQRELAEGVPEESAAAHAPPREPAATAKHAPPSRPLSRVAESAKRFLVQVGVFSNHANAEELVTRLNAAGIPAQIESRVQVGPFASRMEADAARAKLKAMGLDEGLLVRR